MTTTIDRRQTEAAMQTTLTIPPRRSAVIRDLARDFDTGLREVRRVLDRHGVTVALSDPDGPEPPVVAVPVEGPEPQWAGDDGDRDWWPEDWDGREWWGPEPIWRAPIERAGEVAEAMVPVVALDPDAAARIMGATTLHGLLPERAQGVMSPALRDDREPTWEDRCDALLRKMTTVTAWAWTAPLRHRIDSETAAHLAIDLRAVRSEYHVAVIRAEGGGWTVTRGVGSHTIQVGRAAGREAAETLGRSAVETAREDLLAELTDRAGGSLDWLMTDRAWPEVRAVEAGTGQTAWDAWQAAAR